MHSNHKASASSMSLFALAIFGRGRGFQSGQNHDRDWGDRGQGHGDRYCVECGRNNNLYDQYCQNFGKLLMANPGHSDNYDFYFC